MTGLEKRVETVQKKWDKLSWVLVDWQSTYFTPWVCASWGYEWSFPSMETPLLCIAHNT